jgi:hypothetical protein
MMPEPSADGVVEDVLVYPAMIRLEACLEAELTKAGIPAGCMATLVPGDQSYLAAGECDDGTCGSAWVRLVRAFPSRDFPGQDTTQATCATRLAFELEVGVLRCVDTIQQDGTGPDAATQLATTRMQLADMAAMHRAIKCCFAGRDTDYVLGAYQPTPFMGGVGGGTWTVTIPQRA